jgi:rare lipoprotein A
MKPNCTRLLVVALTVIVLSSCGVAHVESGKAIYCPGVQLEKIAPELLVNEKDWQAPGEDDGYVDVTNLLNGKKTRAHILMKKTTSTGTVIISINKQTAEALGMVYTGLAPVEIKYKRTL